LIELLSLFANNLLPIFMVAGFGFVMGKTFQISPRSISHLTFYLFSPCLAFSLISKSEVGLVNILRMFGFGTACMVVVGLAAWLMGRAFRLERRTLAAVLITTMFMNAGNYGMPVVEFAFGQEALAFAIPFYVTMSILANTVGVFIASMGKLNARQALLGVSRMPVIYAVAAALLFKGMEWSLPTSLDRGVTIMGNAAIPTMLVVLGLQFNVVKWNGQYKALFLAAGTRLLLGPLVAILLAPVFALQGFAFQAGVLQSAMPSAVLTTVLATEFDAEPSFVSYVVFVSTLLSPLTVTPILFFLGA
jgi:hypothetical protein